MRKLTGLPLAALAFAAACADSPTSPAGVSPFSTGPQFDHVVGTNTNQHVVGVKLTDGTAANTKNVEVIWHKATTAGKYHIQLCSAAYAPNCPAGSVVDLNVITETPTAHLTLPAGHLTHTFTGVAVPTTQTTYYARVKAQATTRKTGTSVSPDEFKDWVNANFTLGTASSGGDTGGGGTGGETSTPNLPPVISLNWEPKPALEGVQVTFSAEGTSDPEARGTITYQWTFSDGSTATGLTATKTYPDEGTAYTVTLTATDVDRFSSSAANVPVPVNNVRPTAAFAFGPTTINEGDAFKISLSNLSDVPADMAELQVAFDCNVNVATPAPLAFANAAKNGDGTLVSPQEATCTTTDNGTRTVAAGVQDLDGGVTTFPATGAASTVTINNVAPSISAFTTTATAPVQLVDGTASAPVSITFSDPALTYDTYSAVITCGNGTTLTPAGITSPAAATCTYTSAGVYTLTATVSDEDGGTSGTSIIEYVVVFDPNGGFVTGGGWINSKAGDCTLSPACEAASGKSTFGFVSKYLPGKTIPDGNTRFQFHAGGLDFKSTSYETLVVSGNRAQYWGRGTVNGKTGYTFRLTGVDGQVSGTDGTEDMFRIEIWYSGETGAVGSGTKIYDNQRGASQTAGLTTTLGGGSIQIKK